MSFLRRVRKLTAAIWTTEGTEGSTVREWSVKPRERKRKRDRGRGRETEKVIKEIMDGSLRELQRTNSHFQFASW